MVYLINFIFFFALSANLGAHEVHTTAASNLGISLAFDMQGNLWRAHVKEGFVQVDKSADNGKTFSEPIKVNHTKQKITADGEARPKIAISPEGHIYVTWTETLKKSYTGYVWFARSIDAGKTFEKPYIMHQDRAEITHAFDALNLGTDGKITVTWIDKRDAIAAKSAGKQYTGAAIYYAVSDNKGASFSPERKLADSSCECCRIAMTSKPNGQTVAMWRHVFEGNERDHMIAEIPPETAKPILHRATFGHWEIDGCPHHGAALAVGGEGEGWWGYHMAYFDGNDAKPGLYYSRMDGVAWASSPAKKFGNNANQASHPAILSVNSKTNDEHLWLVWREIEAKNYKVMGMFSDDGGRSWSDTKVLAGTSDKADYPLLIQHKKQAYLAWNTLKDGFKLIQLKP